MKYMTLVLSISIVAITGFYLISCSNYLDISIEDVRGNRTVLFNHEPNDSRSEARSIDIGLEESQAHSLYPEGDVDWISFNAEAGRLYAIETFSTAGYGMSGSEDVDTYIYLYDTYGQVILAEDDDSGPTKGFSKISYKFTESGTYYIKVVDYETHMGYSPGKTGSYMIKVTGNKGMRFYPDGLWHESAHRSHNSDGISWYYGIEGLWTYETGDRNFGALTSDPIDLAMGSPKLYFWEWCQDEPGEFYEDRYVQVSTDGGIIWNNVYKSEDDSATWIETWVDLSAYAGQQVLIRFYFDTLDPAINDFEGWYIDEIEIW